MRRLLAATAALALATTLAACGGDGGSSDNSSSGSGSQEMRSIKVGAIPIVDVAPIYLGVEQGFFKDRNIDVEIVQTTGGAAAVPGVVAGDFQFAFANITSVLLAQSTGLPLKVVASGNASTGDEKADFAGIVVPPGSSITSAKGLEGHTVAVNNLKNIGEVSIRAAIEKDGGDPDKVKFVELPFPDMPAALAGGQVEAAWLVEPFFTVAKQAGNTLISSNLAVTAPDMTIGTYFTTEQQIAEDKSLTDDFTAAIQESLKYAQDNPDEVRRILLTYTQIKPEVADAITLPAFPTEINRNSVQTIADLMVKYGMAEKAPDVDAVLPAN
ncbi:MAG: NitT/TauT family transport system substrate-binding protein [Blastococcus sp.]|jgi:NitT/TauT family transport system substrate-binding protein|nr:NitT/TauT family transport system substrate-binding protein [Blastococcus sp.]